MIKNPQTAFAALSVLCFFMTGCSSTRTQLADNASGKNIDISGYLMLGKAEMINPDSAAPTGKLLIGRVNYKSRLIAVDKNKQIPTAGSFRAVRNVSLFGTEETIIEYDFTAADAQSAANICQVLEYQKNRAETEINSTDQ